MSNGDHSWDYLRWHLDVFQREGAKHGILMDSGPANAASHQLHSVTSTWTWPLASPILFTGFCLNRPALSECRYMSSFLWLFSLISPSPVTRGDNEEVAWRKARYTPWTSFPDTSIIRCDLQTMLWGRGYSFVYVDFIFQTSFRIKANLSGKNREFPHISVPTHPHPPPLLTSCIIMVCLLASIIVFFKDEKTKALRGPVTCDRPPAHVTTGLTPALSLNQYSYWSSQSSFPQGNVGSGRASEKWWLNFCLIFTYPESEG